METVSVVILSLCRNDADFEMNQRCITSLLLSETEMEFEVIVVESNREWDKASFHYDFHNVRVITPDEPFRFNRFLNIGIRAGRGRLLILANNDVIFHKEWLTRILEVKAAHPEIMSFCPFDRTSPFLSWEKFRSKRFIKGYRVPVEFVGWCVVIYRHVLEEMGMLDESFDLYFQDNDLARTLRHRKVAHAMVPASFVQHIGGATTGVIDASTTPKYQEDKEKYLTKWKKNGASLSGFLRTTWSRIKKAQWR